MLSSRHPISQCETRQRLLEAAGEVFAEHGFRAATIRDICARAGSNVASVNYHFGSKEQIYFAVLRFAHGCADVELAEEGQGNADPAGLLRSFIRSFMLRLLDTGRPAWHAKLMSREMIEPTAALDALIDEGMRPRLERLQQIIDALVDHRLPEKQVYFCAHSILGQCLFYRHAQPVIARIDPRLEYSPGQLLELADHIADFSIAAMQGMAGKAISQTEDHSGSREKPGRKRRAHVREGKAP